jgi:LacI family transcriptional regulator
MQEHNLGLPEEDIAYPEASTFEEGYRMMREKWDYFRLGAYTAVFGTNDMIGLGAMKFLLEQGMKVPEQVAVMGFDDIDISAISNPSLTTIHVDTEQMGQTACVLLDKLIRRKSVQETILELEPELVVRQST